MNRNLLAPRDLRKAEQAYTNAGRHTLKWRRRKHWLRVCDRYFRHTPSLAPRPLRTEELPTITLSEFMAFPHPVNPVNPV